MNDLQIITSKPHNARVLIAIGLKKIAVVIATDSDWVQVEVDNLGSYCDDIGILENEDYESAPGVYLWEGILRVVMSGPFDCQEPETSYVGKMRPVTVEEFHALLEMSPPVPEPFCLDEDES